MKHFFWLQSKLFRLSNIKIVSKVSEVGTEGGGFIVWDEMHQDNLGFSISYPTMKEAVAVHSALIEALENEHYG